MTDDEKSYEIAMKLTTYLKRQAFLSSRLMKEEQQFSNSLLHIRDSFPPEIFNEFIKPILETLESRFKTVCEMSEASKDFILLLNEMKLNSSESPKSEKI